MTSAFATPEEFKNLALANGAFGIREYLKSGYEIVHQIKGRIRLRIPRLGYDRNYGDRLIQMLKAVVGITQVNINLQAKSLTMQYEENTNAATLIRSLILTAPKVVEVVVSPMPNQTTSDSKILDNWTQIHYEINPLFPRLAIVLLEVMGTICFFIGIIGLLLPVLPGTPFLILGSLCFLAASELSLY
ncbi:HMA2 domain-containing protein [Floridanema evergladense]|uniref:HMA2 domain-containing protein n=1 Tax=Floridaenema evergladense BLCC-F167 TaxID=3153639 RepID=A0ABV4WUS9_9CYAN